MFFQHLGDDTDVVAQLASGNHPFFDRLASAKNPIVIVGSECLQRNDGGAILALVQQLAEKVRAQSGCGDEWRVMNVLHRVASQVSRTCNMVVNRKYAINYRFCSGCCS